MLINQQSDLDSFCSGLKGAPFLTVDTEFLREKTYYPKLCLIQVSGPDGKAAAIDPLAGDIDLAPFFELMDDRKIVKVFHAARQDLEIFYNISGRVPSPLFDTQIAAMVCGFGESVGYENLVRKILGKQVDKSVQFTDWSHRPLGKRHLQYALNDVIHLIDIYKTLDRELQKRGRKAWLESEDAILSDPKTYEIDPRKIWKRIKVRSPRPRTLAALRELAAWRELEAQRRDQPRNWVMRDESLVDIAVHMPQTPEELARARGLSADMARGRIGQQVLEALALARALPESECPKPLARKEPLPQELTPVLEMLRMLLRINCADNEVVPKIVASTDELEELVLDDEADIPAMRGWRFELFGREALELKHGKISLTLADNRVVKKIVEP